MTSAWLLRRLVGDARRHGGVWLALVVAFAVAGFCAAGARVVVGRAGVAAREAPSHLVVSLKDDLADPEVAELQQVLRRLPGVEDVRSVSAREGLDRIVSALADRAPLLDGVGPDLMFPTLEITARPADAAAGLAFRLRRLRGVADVDLVRAPTLEAEPTSARRAVLGGRAAGIVAGAASLLGLLTALAFLRARVRPELAVLLALGVTRATGARPALVLGSLAAGLGAAAGIVAASGVFRAWLGASGFAAREGAIGVAVLIGFALVASRLALVGVEAAGAS